MLSGVGPIKLRLLHCDGNTTNETRAPRERKTFEHANGLHATEVKKSFHTKRFRCAETELNRRRYAEPIRTYGAHSHSAHSTLTHARCTGEADVRTAQMRSRNAAQLYTHTHIHTLGLFRGIVPIVKFYTVTTGRERERMREPFHTCTGTTFSQKFPLRACNAMQTGKWMKTTARETQQTHQFVGLFLLLRLLPPSIVCVSLRISCCIIIIIRDSFAPPFSSVAVLLPAKCESTCDCVMRARAEKRNAMRGCERVWMWMFMCFWQKCNDVRASLKRSHSMASKNRANTKQMKCGSVWIVSNDATTSSSMCECMCVEMSRAYDSIWFMWTDCMRRCFSVSFYRHLRRLSALSSFILRTTCVLMPCQRTAFVFVRLSDQICSSRLNWLFFLRWSTKSERSHGDCASHFVRPKKNWTYSVLRASRFRYTYGIFSGTGDDFSHGRSQLRNRKKLCDD